MGKFLKKIGEFFSGRIFWTGLLIAVQIVWGVALFLRLLTYSVWLDAALTALSMVILLLIIAGDENPAYKISWMLVVGVLPLFGGLLYLLVGNKRYAFRIRHPLDQMRQRTAPLLRQEETVAAQLQAADPRVAGTARYLAERGGFPLYAHTETRYYPIGEELYAAMLEALEEAQSFIFLEYFIIAEGEMWDGILDVLRRKAAQGVDVRVMYDDMGSLNLVPTRYPKQLAKWGIRCQKFNPFVPVVSVVMNNRDHRKLLIIDGHTAFSGGVNLGDEYINKTSRYGHWKDTGFRLRGEAVWSDTVMFLEMWNAFCPTDDDLERFRPTVAFESDGYVQPFGDSPLDDEPTSETLYIDLLSQATDYVYIYTPYLAISNEMQTALCTAAKRGVDVRMVTPGTPDGKVVGRLTRSYYRPLLSAGVHIYEYTPGFLHAKSYLCDDKLAVVGTINMDFRSLYLHFECGTLFVGSSVVASLKADVLDTLSRCTEITQKTRRRSMLLDAILRMIAPLM